MAKPIGKKGYQRAVKQMGTAVAKARIGHTDVCPNASKNLWTAAGFILTRGRVSGAVGGRMLGEALEE